MIEPVWFWWGLALPAILCAAAVVALDRWQQTGLGWPVGLCVGFTAGYHATEGWPPLPPVQSQQWLLTVLMPAAFLVSCLALVRRVWCRRVWMFRAALAFSAAPLLLQSYLEYHWSASQSTVYAVGFGVVCLLIWSVLARIATDRTCGRWLAAALLVTSGGVGLTTLFSGSQTLGQLGLALAATLAGGGVAVLLAFDRQSYPTTTAMIDVPIVLLAGLLLNGRWYAEMASVHSVLLGLSPLAFGVSVAPGVRRLQTWQRIALGLVLTAIFVAAAVFPSAIQFGRELNQTGTDSPYSHLDRVSSAVSG